MKRFTLLLCISPLIFSCADESMVTTPSITKLMNLKVGNYWIYDWYEINTSTGSVTALNKRDSIWIEKDTIINGRTCFIRKGGLLGSKTIRKSVLFDSLNSIYSFPDREMRLTRDESIISTVFFGSEDNPLAIGYYSIDNTKVPIEVPAGNFASINFRGRIEPQQPDYPYGVRYNDNFYTDNIGLTKLRTYNYSSPNDVEMRLVRYGTSTLK